MAAVVMLFAALAFVLFILFGALMGFGHGWFLKSLIATAAVFLLFIIACILMRWLGAVL